jgi:cysteine desulfurase
VRELRAGGRKLFFHTDAVQAVGKIKVDVEEIGCDLLSASAHKLYAPKGIGALYVRRGVRLHPQNIGGHQERDRRGGTEPVHLIAGFGRASEIAHEEMETDRERLSQLRDRLEHQILERVPDAFLNGNAERRIPNILNISFRGIEGEGLLINLDMQGIAVSTGSACSSGTLEPSPVIRAIGREDDLARGAIRFSFGKKNTSEDVPAAVENLRRLSPKYRTLSAT